MGFNLYIVRRGLLLALFFCVLRGFALAIEPGGSTAIEISAKLSRELKSRLQDHLDRLFGEGRSEIFVHVDVGFSKDIKEDLDRTLKAFLSGELTRAMKSTQQAAESTGNASDPNYRFLFPGLDSQAESSAGATQATAFILPGFTLQGAAWLGAQQAAPAGNHVIPTSPFSDANFLYSIGLEIKRVFIKVALDEKLPPDAESKVQALIGSLMDLNPARGDRILLTRFRLPDPILELFKNPQFLAVVFKWAVVAALLLLCLGVGTVLIAFIISILSRFLGRWVEVIATMRAQSMEMRLDFPQWMREAFPAIRLQHRAELPGPSEAAVAAAPSPAFAAAGEVMGGAQSMDLTIQIPSDRAFSLYHLIGTEEPEHIAMVVANLPAETRRAFLAYFEGERLAAVMQALANPRFVEPELMQRWKMELEKRVLGMIGGETDMVKTLDSMSLKMRAQMLADLESSNPTLYQLVRKRVFLFEDLDSYTEEELGAFLGKIALQDLAQAISGNAVPDFLKKKIFDSLPARSTETLKELIDFSKNNSMENAMEAQERILKLMARSVAEGGLRHPTVQISSSGPGN